MKPKTLKIVAVVAVAIALVGGVGLSMPANAADPRYISVTATGTTNVTPDAVRINAAVSLVGKTSASALAESSTTASAVRKALVANKVSTKDVATQSVNIYPEYSYPQDGGKRPWCAVAAPGGADTLRPSHPRRHRHAGRHAGAYRHHAVGQRHSRGHPAA